MNCTPMKLYSRKDNPRSNSKEQCAKCCEETEYYSSKNYGYSLSFVRKLLEDPREYPKLSVKTIKLPENAVCYNSGCSLDKWSKKKPRLKSANKNGLHKNAEVLDENAYDINEILDSLGNLDTTKEDLNSFEMNSDIEELWRKSLNKEECYKELKHQIDDKKNHKLSKKHMKRKLKKCIKFSFSKPPSPQTEQVIRIDISSTISVNMLKKTEQPSGSVNKSASQIKRENHNMIAPNQEQEHEEHNFVICCSQLPVERKSAKSQSCRQQLLS